MLLLVLSLLNWNWSTCGVLGYLKSYSTLFFYNLSFINSRWPSNVRYVGLRFEEKKRLEIHKQVHGRKSKVTEYGSPEFSQDRLRG
jgi:hypothetical protein